MHEDAPGHRQLTDDFELLVSLNVFNESLMNDAVYKFKRYEDASLTYTGIDSHEADAQVGLYSTSISREEYDLMAGLQAQSMNAPGGDGGDAPDRPLAPVKSKPAPPRAATPAANPAGGRQRTPARKAPDAPKPQAAKPPVLSTWRPAFVPPVPVAPAAKPAVGAGVDVSGVGPGTAVVHRAFGEGVVERIETKPTGSAYVHVRFGDALKSFGYPGAFYDGFLRLKA